MLILGIESSCDDTAVALLDCSSAGCFVVREANISQIDIHKKYGGVVPEIAGRMHAEKILPLIEDVLQNNHVPEVIAVTSGPGLITGLIVGTEAARTFAWLKNIPLVAVNHISGHIHAIEINRPPTLQYPSTALVVSGGHTEIILLTAPGQYQMLGATLDDAAGECFDKIAKLLNLSYPGGPQISHLGEKGNNTAVQLPRPMLHEKNLNFSFAGLKTAALYWLRAHPLATININDFCASVEQAIVDVLVAKTIDAIKLYHTPNLILAGGVAANQKLRASLQIAAQELSINFFSPTIPYCMDNAAMIAVAGYQLALAKKFTHWRDLKADPNWELGR